MTRYVSFVAVVALLAMAILPAMQSTGAVHDEPEIAMPGTWYTVSALDKEDFDFQPVKTVVTQNGVVQERTWDPKEMTIASEFRTHGINDTWAYRTYGSHDVDAYLNWVVLNKAVNATSPNGPGITFGFLVREVNMKNITVTISGHRGGSPATEVYNIQCTKMENAMINLSRIDRNSVFFDYYPGSVISVNENSSVGLYGLGFKDALHLKIVGKNGTLLDTQITSYNYVAAYNWAVTNDTSVGFYNVTMEGTDLFGNSTVLRMEVEVTPPICPTWPMCLQVPPKKHDQSYEWLKTVIPVLVISIVLVVLFTRLRRNSLLDQAMRARIYSTIQTSQGIHFNELMRQLEVKPGVLSHHINILEREKFIKSLQDGTYRRFFLYDTNAELRVSFNKIQEKILALINRKPGIMQKEISKEIGSSGFVTNYHVRILKDAGMVLLEKDGKNLRCFPAATP
jgi:DNA-binding MarR family transcriptional regulator